MVAPQGLCHQPQRPLAGHRDRAGSGAPKPRRCPGQGQSCSSQQHPGHNPPARGHAGCPRVGATGPPAHLPSAG